MGYCEDIFAKLWFDPQTFQKFDSNMSSRMIYLSEKGMKSLLFYYLFVWILYHKVRVRLFLFVFEFIAVSVFMNKKWLPRFKNWTFVVTSQLYEYAKNMKHNNNKHNIFYVVTFSNQNTHRCKQSYIPPQFRKAPTRFWTKLIFRSTIK